MLYAIGGALDCEGEMEILKKMLADAYGTDSSVVVITTATNYPEEAKRKHKDVFSRLQVPDCTVLYIKDKAEANDADIVKTVAGADIVFFTGGDQLKLAKVLNGTAVMKAVFQNLAEGKIVAGTSAGAAAMSKQMIRGLARKKGQKKKTLLSKGFGFSKDLIIDMHFSQRRRLTRLFTKVAQHPTLTGLGIDENTAAILKDDGSMDVIGAGTVTIVSGFEAAATKQHKKMPRKVLRSGESCRLQ